MTTLNQRGSSHIVVALALIVVAVAGFAGYRVMNAGNTAAPSEVSRSTSSEPASIKSTADVKKASKALDNTAADSVNPSQLDNDLNAVL